MGAITGKRGRDPVYVAPPADELRGMLAQHAYLSDVRRHYGVSHKTLLRWLDERGVPAPLPDNASLPGEEWRPVLDWEGLYEVSDMGRVRSLPRRGHKGRILKPYVNDKNFPRLMVGLSDGKRENGGREAFPHVHRLVLESFVGPRPEGMQCLHANGDPGDNRLSNLRWGTKVENWEDAKRHRVAGQKPAYRRQSWDLLPLLVAKYRNALIAIRDDGQCCEAASVGKPCDQTCRVSTALRDEA